MPTSHQQVARALALILAALGACALLAGGASAGGNGHMPVPDFPIGSKAPYLRECASFKEAKKRACYIAGMLRQVEKSGDPANELPVIDKTVRTSGGYAAANCHILMHEVGRRSRARTTSRSRRCSSTCPSPTIRAARPGSAWGWSCTSAPSSSSSRRRCSRSAASSRRASASTRAIHGSGHAFMRGYHGVLETAVIACKTLGSHTPDCAQGAFHDYWISLSGGDGTKKPANADVRPRSVCAKYAFPRPCWYRFFWERKQSLDVSDERDIAKLCKGIAERAARRLRRRSVTAPTCRRARRPRAWSAADGAPGLRELPARRQRARARRRPLRAAPAPALVQEPARGRASASATPGSGARSTSSRTASSSAPAAPRLQLAGARAACVAGARKLGEPLGTFS